MGNESSNNEFRFYIAIDFGTDGTCIAYACDNEEHEVFIHDKWHSSRYGSTVKPRCAILLDDKGKTKAFGIDAIKTYMAVQSSYGKKWLLFDRFKMSLYDCGSYKKTTNTTDIVDELIATNLSKYPAENVFVAAFKHLHKQSKMWLERKQIQLQHDQIQWIITVPAIWNYAAKNKMKQWATKAGLINYTNVENQCKIVCESDCASLCIQYINKFKNGDRYILIDAGAGTVDIACHEVVGEFAVKEIFHPSGGKWGSAYIDDQYIKFLKLILKEEWIDEFQIKDPTTYVEIINNFQLSKSTFYSNCEMNIKSNKHNVELPFEFCAFIEEKMEDSHDGMYEYLEEKINDFEFMGDSGTITMNDTRLEIHVDIWKKYMFDPLINPTVNHIRELLNDEEKLNQKCDYLCLVGGLSCSKYFQFKISKEFGSESKFKLKIIIPPKPMLSVVTGAAYYGIIQNFVVSRILSKTYGLKVNIKIKEASQLKIPHSFIMKNAVYNNDKKKTYMNNYFHILAKKNDVITPNQPHSIKCYRKNLKQKTINMTIVSSNEQEPVITKPHMIIGQITFDFDRNDKVSKYLTTDFYFSATKIQIIAYPPNNKKKMQIKTIQFGYDDNYDEKEEVVLSLSDDENEDEIFSNIFYSNNRNNRNNHMFKIDGIDGIDTHDERQTMLCEKQINQLAKNGYCDMRNVPKHPNVMLLIEGYVRKNYNLNNININTEIVGLIVHYFPTPYNSDVYVGIVIPATGVWWLMPKQNTMISGYLTMLSGYMDDGIILVTQVPPETMHHVLKYLGHHKGVEPDPLPCPVRSIHMSQIVSDKWDAIFIDAFTKKVIFEIILAANYMDIKSLLHLGCAKIASLIKQLDQKEIDRIIEEEERYREQAWKRASEGI